MGSVRRRGDRVRVSLEAAEVVTVDAADAQVVDLLDEPPAHRATE